MDKTIITTKSGVTIPLAELNTLLENENDVIVVLIYDDEKNEIVRAYLGDRSGKPIKPG